MGCKSRKSTLESDLDAGDVLSCSVEKEILEPSRMYGI